jgi:hypothetical protein
MTIQIPDDLARALQGFAAAQKKTIEEVAVKNLGLLLDPAASPQALLRSLRALPHPSPAAVDELESAIRAARLPVREEGIFDGRPQG